MNTKYHFKISKYNPKEEIFDGMMTFTEARKYMDENATPDRRVSYLVFDDHRNHWVDLGQIFHGNRLVYEKGVPYIIDSDYRNIWEKH